MFLTIGFLLGWYAHVLWTNKKQQIRSFMPWNKKD